VHQLKVDPLRLDLIFVDDLDRTYKVSLNVLRFFHLAERALAEDFLEVV
jgi:reverse gyrase